MYNNEHVLTYKIPLVQYSRYWVCSSVCTSHKPLRIFNSGHFFIINWKIYANCSQMAVIMKKIIMEQSPAVGVWTSNSRSNGCSPSPWPTAQWCGWRWWWCRGPRRTKGCKSWRMGSRSPPSPGSASGWKTLSRWTCTSPWCVGGPTEQIVYLTSRYLPIEQIVCWTYLPMEQIV